ncbi:O-unit flippase-like protein [Vibrio lentus]|uniref:O-unit flippase-like protein n=1 Tax=Vibrio lentus TaxID=136468 RepID=UPI00178CB83C|nr:O-unit flippase-like protein [Vibrio lentus]MDN3632435.1 O-unit flippase-like protein [Vibrio lentus]
MINKASKKDIIWGYLAQFLNIGSGIIILPVAIKLLSAEDMGLWYLFMAIAGFVQLLEFGIQPTISRMTSYIYAGALELLSEGLPKISNNIDYQLLYDLISAAKKMYLYVSVVAAFILLLLGTLYLDSFKEFKQSQMIAWCIFSSSTVINLYFTYFNGLLSGRGNQTDSYRIIAISKLLMLIITIPLLWFDWGLLSMSVGTLASVVLSRILYHRTFYNSDRDDIRELNKLKGVAENLVNTIWLSAWKLGVTSFGGFMILKVNTFVASSYLGLKVAASYGLTIQVVGLIYAVSNMLFVLSLPKMNVLQSQNKKSELKRFFVKINIYTQVMFLVGSLLLLTFGSYFLSILSPNITLLATPILLLILATYQLELNHAVCATYLTTLNKVPFLNASLISGFSIFGSSVYLMNNTNLGILGLVVSQFLVQALYNNWYWPREVYKSLYGK